MDSKLMMKPFQIKHYSLPRQPRTERQERATDRNFRIMRLRGLWCLAYILTKDRREAVQAIIDGELRDLGAEPHRDRLARERADLARRLRRDEAPNNLDLPIPF